MPFAARGRVGPYEIVDLLGAGGMGEVYRAHDSRLRRDVALKVLPSTFSNDSQLMARFEREAQLLASLNHPNIASIYGFQESDGVRALVLELVEGATLAERIRQGPMPPNDALAVARQIGEALEYAHEKGIVHRDLKPANIKLTPDDSVKVLDFGLAKALADGSSSTAEEFASPTLTAVSTRVGIVIGTPAYMSPEQARGRKVDRRADIWSFGCVLFEMLAGKPAFAGETVTDTIAAVLTKEPPSGELPEGIPPGIRRLIEKCLEKDPRRRLQAIGDARVAIEDSLSGKDGELQSLPGGAAQPFPLAISASILTVVFLLAAAVLAGWWIHARNAKSPAWIGELIPGPNVALGGRISPDGRMLAFQAMIANVTQVAVASPDTGDWRLLTQDRQHGFVNEISWAPDGSKVYYDRTIATPVGIYSVNVLDGGERRVLENAGSPEVLPDGSLLIIRPDANGRWRIHHYWPESQRLEPLSGWIPIETTIGFRVFPDGKEAVFNGFAHENESTPRLYLMDIATGTTRPLAPDLASRHNNEGYPIAITPDGRGVLWEVSAGDLHRVIVLPRDGKGGIQTLVTLTKPPWYMDMGKDGSLYLDQIERPHELLRFPVTGGPPEVLASSDTYVLPEQYGDPVETSDGRFLLDSEFSGRGRLLIGKAGEDFVPLLDTSEETSSPAVSLGNNEVALLLGQGEDAMVVIASTVEGRLIRRLPATKGMRIKSMGASPDGRTLYLGAGGFIWTIPAADGALQKIAAGDNVSLVPNGRELVVTLSGKSNPTLVKVSATGNKEEEIRVQSGYSIAPVLNGARSINSAGKMLISVSPSDSWFYRVAALDLATGQVTPIRVDYPGDTLSGNWASDGRVLSVGLRLRSHLWRFRLDAK